MQVDYLDTRAPEHRSRSPFFVGSLDAVGVDICAYLPNYTMTILPGKRAAIPTGVSLAVPKMFYCRVAPRSGLAFKNGIDVLAGVVDPDYRGEVKVILQNHGDEPFVVHDGDRVAQLVMEAAAAWTPVSRFELPETARGEK